MPNLPIIITQPLPDNIKPIIEAIDNDANHDIVDNVNLKEEFEITIGEDYKLETSLAHYAALKSYKFTEYIIETLGVPPDRKTKKGFTFLHCAILGGKKNIVSLLLNNNSNAEMGNDNGESCLHLATINGDKPLMQLLLSKNLAPNQGNREGFTPLHYAARFDNPEVIEPLVVRGALPYQGNREGITPLHFAGRYNSSKVVKPLVDNGAKISQGAHFGINPLHEAVRYNSDLVIKPLIEVGISPNQGTSSETFALTPLHMAAFQNNPKVIKALIENGADKNQGNKDGYTPLHIAIVFANKEATSELINARADLYKGNKDLDICLLLATGKGKIDFKKVESFFAKHKFPAKPIPNEEAYKKVAELLLPCFLISYFNHKDSLGKNALDYAREARFGSIETQLNLYKCFHDSVNQRGEKNAILKYLNSPEDFEFVQNLNKSFCKNLDSNACNSHFTKLRALLPLIEDANLKNVAKEYNIMLNELKKDIIANIESINMQQTHDLLHNDNLLAAEHIPVEAELGMLGLDANA
jgi:ankyrin repeat protein